MKINGRFQRQCKKMASGYSGKSTFFQPQLTVNQPGDAYEQEADHVADRVMNSKLVETPFFSAAPARNTPVSRMCDSCKDEEIHRKSATNSGGGIPAPPIVHTVISSAGKPLDLSTRHFMESRLGHDFDQVKIHTGSEAAASARAVNALAYTTGNHIVFNSGQYAPETDSGKRLLAHELTHVLQQTPAGTLHKKEIAIKPVVPSVAEKKLTEREIIGALAHNKTLHKDPELIGKVRGLLGLDPEPAVVDRDLVFAVASFQATHDLTQDGRIGQITATLLAEEAKEMGDDDLADQILKRHSKALKFSPDLCSCIDKLKKEIAKNNVFIPVYQSCQADPANTSGGDIEDCVKAHFASKGSTITTVGSTDSSGNIKVKEQKGKCADLMKSEIFSHEWVHATHTRELQEKFGKDTKAFDKAFYDPIDWAEDEVNSRNIENNYLEWLISRLIANCK